MKYYSRRELYAAGEMLGDCVTEHKVGGGRIYGGGGKGGGGGGAPQQTTAYQTNLPEYARPYVETMLGATQKQLFNTQTSPEGTTEVTGFKPYQPYSTNPADYVAGFSPLQQQAQSTAANMQMPGEYGAAAGMTGMAGLGALGAANRAGMAGYDYARQATNPYAVQAYMNPYLQASLQPQLNQLAEQGQIQAQQAAGQATAAGAFGGTRSALQQNLAQRNALMAQQQALGQGYNQAFNQAQQAQQFGANLGLQGQQAALSGYGQLGNLASGLANIGTQGLQAQQGIAGLQNQLGAQQQAQEQSKINQAIQDYATSQQYPLMQLGFMSNMLRGLPMQSTTTQQYQAQPSLAQQAIGLGGTAAMLGKAGVFKEGGSVGLGYANRGVVDSMRDKLEAMAETDPAGLKKLVAQSSSKEVKDLGNEILSGIALGNTGKLGTNLAGGGIIAFNGEDNSYVDPAGNYAYGDSNYSAGDLFHDIGTWGRSLVGLPEYKDFEETEREKKRKALAEKGKEVTEDKKDEKPPVVKPPVAPPAAPGSNVPPSGGITSAMPDMAGWKKAYYDATGIKEGPGEKNKTLMDYLEKRQAGLPDTFSTNRALRGAEMFAKFGSTAGPIGKVASETLGAYAKGEIEAKKEQDRIELEGVKLQADLEAARDAKARNDFESYTKHMDAAENRKKDIQVATINAQSHLAAANRPGERERIAKDLMAANPGMTLEQAVSRATELMTVSDEAKKQDMVKSAFTEANKSVSPGGANYSQYKKLQEKDPAAAKQFVIDLAKQHYQGMQDAINAVAGGTSSGKVDTSNPLLKG